MKCTTCGREFLDLIFAIGDIKPNGFGQCWYCWYRANQEKIIVHNDNVIGNVSMSYCPNSTNLAGVGAYHRLLCLVEHVCMKGHYSGFPDSIFSHWGQECAKLITQYFLWLEKEEICQVCKRNNGEKKFIKHCRGHTPNELSYARQGQCVVM